MTQASFYLDHFYFHDQDHKFRESLLQKGYFNYEPVTRHPGGLTCKFLAFENPARGISSPYLEFLHIDPSSTEKYDVGLSLGSKTNLDEIFKNNEAIKKKKATFFHKNYEWEKYPNERKTGWNFIMFEENPPIKDLYFWVSEYEVDPSVPPRVKPDIIHANSTRGIVGCVLLLDEAEIASLGEIMGVYYANNKFTLASGYEIQVLSRDSEFFKDNKYNLPAILLECESLETYISVAKPDEVREFNGIKYAVIKNQSIGWDLYTKEKI